MNLMYVLLAVVLIGVILDFVGIGPNTRKAINAVVVILLIVFLFEVLRGSHLGIPR